MPVTGLEPELRGLCIHGATKLKRLRFRGSCWSDLIPVAGGTLIVYIYIYAYIITCRAPSYLARKKCSAICVHMSLLSVCRCWSLWEAMYIHIYVLYMCTCACWEHMLSFAAGPEGMKVWQPHLHWAVKSVPAPLTGMIWQKAVVTEYHKSWNLCW